MRVHRFIYWEINPPFLVFVDRLDILRVPALSSKYLILHSSRPVKIKDDHTASSLDIYTVGNASRFPTLHGLESDVGWTTFTCPPASEIGNHGPPAVIQPRSKTLKATALPLGPIPHQKTAVTWPSTPVPALGGCRRNRAGVGIGRSDRAADAGRG